MNANLANYLFDKETLYRNYVTQEKAVIEEQQVVIAEKPIVIQEKIASQKEKIIKSSLPSLILKSKVLILTESISDNEKAFLAKILNAVGLSLDQIDLIELNKVQTIDYQSFTALNMTKKFISFGVGLGKLNWDVLLNIYQIKNVAAIDYLLSDELRIVEADLNLKRRLWVALKQMFENYTT